MAHGRKRKRFLFSYCICRCRAVCLFRLQWDIPRRVSQAVRCVLNLPRRGLSAPPVNLSCVAASIGKRPFRGPNLRTNIRH